MGESFVEVGFGPTNSPARFDLPEARVTAREPAEVPGALAALDSARSAGKWLAGYASYELGYTLEPRLSSQLPKPRRLPLLDFGVFQGPKPAHSASPGGRIGPFHPRWDRNRYAAAFGRVSDYIRAGDIYQANLTFPLDGSWEGAPGAIVAALAARQPVGFAAQVALGDVFLLSRSPELFFALDGPGGIEARPMKGTAPRDEDPARDAAVAATLALDPKN